MCVRARALEDLPLESQLPLSSGAPNGLQLRDTAVSGAANSDTPKIMNFKRFFFFKFCLDCHHLSSQNLVIHGAARGVWTVIKSIHNEEHICGQCSRELPSCCWRWHETTSNRMNEKIAFPLNRSRFFTLVPLNSTKMNLDWPHWTLLLSHAQLWKPASYKQHQHFIDTCTHFSNKRGAVAEADAS